MFIKSLLISTPTKVIRDIRFHKGLNLIVDETPQNVSTETGNNVGKTTVLRLIDFCLGKTPDNIYKNPENKHQVYSQVHDFLQENKVSITLILVDNLDFETYKVEICRNFLSRQDNICTINGEQILQKDFDNRLMETIFPTISVDKPSFRQIISHNIRYDDTQLTNTLKTLGAYAKDEEYETLYLYLFGCNNDMGVKKQELLAQIKNEQNFKRRLEKDRTRSDYKSALDVIEGDIERLNKQKDSLNINPNINEDIELLNEIKRKMNQVSSEITQLSIRKDLILETIDDFQSQQFNVDTVQLKMIYQQASSLMQNMHKTFEELVTYHNQMIANKIQFIQKELPIINETIDKYKDNLSGLTKEEEKLSEKIIQSDTFDELEKIIQQLTQLHQKKGNFESIIDNIDKVDDCIKVKEQELAQIGNSLFSKDFRKHIDGQISKFNRIYSDISERLYNEKYAITCDTKTKNGHEIYVFSPIDANFSSGKKQGEISCFDIAYTIFADNEHIPCLHFLLNDKKELVHHNQLLKIAEVVTQQNIQFIASILEDKLPVELKDEKYNVIKLSQTDKLFRIEQFIDSNNMSVKY